MKLLHPQKKRRNDEYTLKGGEKMKKGNYFTMAKLDGQKARIDIYGDIVSEGWRWGDDETSAVSFRNALGELGEIGELDLHINSGGGDVFEAVAIFNMIQRHKAKVNVHVDGLAASAASVIAMAGDTVHMPANSMLMIHNAWSGFMGNHHELRAFADTLEKINNSSVKQAYIEKNPEINVEELSALMDKETWLSASEALELGLIDEITGAVQVAASITTQQLERYENAPEVLSSTVEDKPAEPVVQVIDKEYLDNAMQQLKNELAESMKPAEPVKNSSISTFFQNINKWRLHNDD